MAQTESTGHVAALLKGLCIIEHLSEGETSLGVLARKMGLPKSSVHRLLDTLAEAGFVTQVGADDHYVLTPRLFEYGARALGAYDLLHIAIPHLRALRNETGETTHIAVRSGVSIIYLHNEESHHSLKLKSRMGYQAPTHTTALGKCMLAWLSRAEQEEEVRRIAFKKLTPNTIADAATLLAHLEAVRRNGYGCSDEEDESGVFCLGAPVFNHYACLTAAVSVSMPKFRHDPAAEAGVVAAVQRTARAISADLGCVDYPIAVA